MKLTVPDWAVHADDEDEILFIAFAWLVAKTVGPMGLKTAYYIHRGDLRIFFKKYTWVFYGNIPFMNSVKKWIYLGKVSKNLYRFSFRDIGFGETKEIELEITNPKIQAIWFYLLAKFNDEKVISKKNNGIHQTRRNGKLSSKTREWLRDR